jgi:hypothetical protein
MIAIFCQYYDDFQELELYPKYMFVRIESVQNIQGVNFTGVIQFNNLYEADQAIIDALYELKNSQPELFLLPNNAQITLRATTQTTKK